MNSIRKLFLFIHCCIGITGFHISGAMAQEAKVDVCHIPAGNPQNPVTLAIGRDELSTHLDHGDSLGACDPKQTVGGDSSRQTQSACTCPRAGVWRVTNKEGWMECSMVGIKRTNNREDKNDGAIWVLDDNCSTIFSEAYEKQREDVIMERGRDCLFFGTAPGKQEGAEAIFDGAYRVETEEFITGEYHMEISSMGMECTGFTPFQIDFLRPLKEKDYAKLEKAMQRELENARKKLVEHGEQIDKYLQKTDGGKALGGRNGQN